MSEFLKNPNLPERKVKTVICGTKDKSILGFFANNSIEVIDNEPNRQIDTAVSEHADMSALHIGGNNIIIDKAQIHLQSKLEERGFNVCLTENEICGCYPEDIKLNFALFGEYAVGNFKHADSNLNDLILKRKSINVKQGYCKCSMLIVSENAIITDDETIHREICKNGIESLLISKGDVSLAGHEYGFIGGASGKISKNTIVFFGNIEKHRDYEIIKAFIESRGCKIVSTDNAGLRDIGGIISLTEE